MSNKMVRAALRNYVLPAVYALSLSLALSNSAKAQSTDANASGSFFETRVARAIPESPAFTLLGINKKPTRVNTSQDLAGHVLNAFDQNGKFVSGFGLDLVPYFVSGASERLKLSDYRKNGSQFFFSNVVVSLAASRAASDTDPSTRGGFGIFYRYDSGDLARYKEKGETGETGYALDKAFDNAFKPIKEKWAHSIRDLQPETYPDEGTYNSLKPDELRDRRRGMAVFSIKVVDSTFPSFQIGNNTTALTEQQYNTLTDGQKQQIIKLLTRDDATLEKATEVDLKDVATALEKAKKAIAEKTQNAPGFAVGYGRASLSADSLVKNLKNDGDGLWFSGYRPFLNASNQVTFNYLRRAKESALDPDDSTKKLKRNQDTNRFGLQLRFPRPKFAWMVETVYDDIKMETKASQKIYTTLLGIELPVDRDNKQFLQFSVGGESGRKGGQNGLILLGTFKWNFASSPDLIPVAKKAVTGTTP